MPPNRCPNQPPAMPQTPRPHDPRSKEQSAKRVVGTFVALLVIAACTMAVFIAVIVLISRSKGFAIFG